MTSKQICEEIRKFLKKPIFEHINAYHEANPAKTHSGTCDECMYREQCKHYKQGAMIKLQYLGKHKKTIITFDKNCEQVRIDIFINRYRCSCSKKAICKYPEFLVPHFHCTLPYMLYVLWHYIVLEWNTARIECEFGIPDKTLRRWKNRFENDLKRYLPQQFSENDCSLCMAAIFGANEVQSMESLHMTSLSRTLSDFRLKLGKSLMQACKLEKRS